MLNFITENVITLNDTTLSGVIVAVSMLNAKTLNVVMRKNVILNGIIMKIILPSFLMLHHFAKCQNACKRFSFLNSSKPGILGIHFPPVVDFIKTL
jgi:hypothetical protein